MAMAQRAKEACIRDVATGSSSTDENRPWQRPEEDTEIRLIGAKRIARIFERADVSRDERRETRVLVSLENLCYYTARTKEEYTNPTSFEILLHRLASEKAKRRKVQPKSQRPQTQDANPVEESRPEIFQEMLKYFLDPDPRNIQNQQRFQPIHQPPWYGYHPQNQFMMCQQMFFQQQQQQQHLQQQQQQQQQQFPPRQHLEQQLHHGHIHSLDPASELFSLQRQQQTQHFQLQQQQVQQHHHHQQQQQQQLQQQQQQQQQGHDSRYVVVAGENEGHTQPSSRQTSAVEVTHSLDMEPLISETNMEGRTDHLPERQFKRERVANTWDDYEGSQMWTAHQYGASFTTEGMGQEANATPQVASERNVWNVDSLNAGEPRAPHAPSEKVISAPAKSRKTSKKPIDAADVEHGGGAPRKIKQPSQTHSSNQVSTVQEEALS